MHKKLNERIMKSITKYSKKDKYDFKTEIFNIRIFMQNKIVYLVLS